MQNTSYYLYQKFEQRGDQDWIPAYPNEYSIDGDGTMPLSAKTVNDPACGYIPPSEPIYRWVNLDPSIYWICDEAPTPPSFNGKWKATYTGGTTSSADCDSSSAITEGEIEVIDLVNIEIGNCVTTIGNYAFNYGESLSSVTMPDSVTSIGNNAFNRCSGLTSVTISSGVTSIGSYAFYKCSGLTSIGIPDSVTSIGMGAFSDCTDLISVSIPSGATEINSYTFENCSSLSSVTIPSGVEDMHQYTFRGCSGLTSVTCLATTPPWMYYAFDDTNNCPIYVPSGSVLFSSIVIK